MYITDFIMGGFIMAYKKECVLMDRECFDCGECDICDLNPDKICNNCCVCIDNKADYKSVEIDEIIEEGDAPLEEDEIGDWKYDEDYIVDYNDEELKKIFRPSNRGIKSSDN